MTKKFAALGNRVVVRPAAREEKTASGIVIPDTVREQDLVRAEVLDVGYAQSDSISQCLYNRGEVTLAPGAVVYYESGDAIDLPNGLAVIDIPLLLIVEV